MKAGRPLQRVISVAVAVLIYCFGTVASFSADPEIVVKITAKRFEYSPSEIRIRKGVPAVLEFTALGRLHGFQCPDLGIRADIPPGKIARVRFVPDKIGSFPFHCDIFCGDGHEEMTGTIIVEE